MESLEIILNSIIGNDNNTPGSALYDAGKYFNENAEGEEDIAVSMVSAFMMILSGESNPIFKKARQYLDRMSKTDEWGPAARFFLNGPGLIADEIKRNCDRDTVFREKLQDLAEWLSTVKDYDGEYERAERFWSLFFPEGAGIAAHRKEKVKELRERRKVAVSSVNKSHVSDVPAQVLFTSNVLLTIPAQSGKPEDLQLSSGLGRDIRNLFNEEQLYWYDHPIQIGVDPEKNEVIYGLRNLDRAVEFERRRGNAQAGSRLKCVLSVSVTHEGIHRIAKKYLEEEIEKAGGLDNIDLYVFTENDTERLLREVLAPAAEHYLNVKKGEDLLLMFGVDGEYGRHYSFLKAIAALWNVFSDSSIKATFKIDLDQVFPQEELAGETGASAFEHLMSPLWGAEGVDSSGRDVELGMIAGALVNERDIGKSIFTPDVPFPERGLSRDEHIFFSLLPQALSTEAEMMTRYGKGGPDGVKTCIQRIHVTGGTVGIFVESLRRHRSFTPSFIGRAEDQAYIMSVLKNDGRRLAYLHRDGLIMRHDKEAFAQEAIESAYTGKLIGDYIRILFFSAYARALADDINKIKDIVDPFTGCFISMIPVTVVYLRFALKAASLFLEGKAEKCIDFLKTGAPRISRAIDFTTGEESPLERQFKKEKTGWELFYDILDAAERAIGTEDIFALKLQGRAKEIIKGCLLEKRAP